MRQTLGLSVAMLALLASSTASEANSYQYVSVFNNYFSPVVQEAVAGEEVRWGWTCTDGSYNGATNCITHRIVAYSGASFDSGNKSAQGSTFSYTLTQTNEIGYRCTLHSSLNGESCSGMCGRITADAKPPVPRITHSPPNSFAIGSANYAGDVNDNRGVAAVWMRFTNAFNGAVIDELVTGPFPSGPGVVQWSHASTIAPGLYSVKAMARDIHGNTNSSAPLTLIKI